jgi:uncharacterized protein
MNLNRISLFKKFHTDTNYYIYDTCTNKILRVSKIIYDIIDKFLLEGSQSVLSYFEEAYPLEALKEAVFQLEQIIEMEQYFSTLRSLRLQFPLTTQEIEKSLDYGIQQLILGITEACNLRCAYCAYSGKYYFQRTHTKRFMPLHIAKSAIEYYDQHSNDVETRCITFYGGEPLLAIETIQQVIDHVKKNFSQNYMFNLSTNGTLLNGETTRLLIENDVALLVSLDGPAEVHNSVRAYPDGDGSFDMIIQNLRALKEEDPNYYKRKVVFRPTISRFDKIESMYKFFSENSENHDLFEGQYVSTGFVDPFDNSMKEGVISTDNGIGYHNLLEKYKQIKVHGLEVPLFFNEMFEVKLKKIHKRDASLIPDSLYPNGICCPGVRRLFCTVDGHYTICERVNSGLIIGDVRHGIDPTKVISLVEHYIKISDADCSRCWGVRFCTNCFTAIYGNQFDIERKRQVCNLFLKELENMMKLYCSIRELNYTAFDNL